MAPYNVGASVECLVLTTQLVVHVREILQLDCRIGSYGHSIGDVGNPVALVAGLNLHGVADDLLGELALDSRSEGMSVLRTSTYTVSLTIVICNGEFDVCGIFSNRQSDSSLG